MVEPLLSQGKPILAYLVVDSMSYFPLVFVHLVINHVQLALLNSFGLEPTHHRLVLLLASLIQEKILLANGRLSLGV